MPSSDKGVERVRKLIKLNYNILCLQRDEVLRFDVAVS